MILNQQKMFRSKKYQIEDDLFNQDRSQLTEKEIALQELMFNNKSANRLSKKKKYFKNKRFRD